VNGDTVTSAEEFRLELLLAPTGATRIDFDNGATVTFDMPARDVDREPVAAAFDPMRNQAAVLSQVVDGGPAQSAGLQQGDTVVAAGGHAIATWQDFVAVIKRSPGVAVPVIVRRDGQSIELAVTPRDTTFENGIRVGRVGVGSSGLAPAAGPAVRQGLLDAIAYGADRTWQTTAGTVKLLGGMFAGTQSPRNIGGPIAIGQLSGQMARQGPAEYLSLMAILSVSLAVLNLLPIPVLDGGHLVFLAIEGVRGRALSLQSRLRLTQVGFVLIIMLMVWAIGNDVLRVIGI
jgi:regulator of sigma E protease